MFDFLCLTSLGIDVKCVTAYEVGVKSSKTQFTPHDIFTWFYDVFVLRCFLCGSEVEQIWMDDSKKIFFFDSCKKTSVSVSTLSVYY